MQLDTNNSTKEEIEKGLKIKVKIVAVEKYSTAFKDYYLTKKVRKIMAKEIDPVTLTVDSKLADYYIDDEDDSDETDDSDSDDSDSNSADTEDEKADAKSEDIKRRIKRHRSQIIQMLPVKMINLNQMMVALQRMLIILKELLILPVKHKMEKYIQEIQIRLLVMHELVNTMCQDKLDII